jgi:hypothetical protein
MADQVLISFGVVVKRTLFCIQSLLILMIASSQALATGLGRCPDPALPELVSDLQVQKQKLTAEITRNLKIEAQRRAKWDQISKSEAISRTLLYVSILGFPWAVYNDATPVGAKPMPNQAPALTEIAKFDLRDIDPQYPQISSVVRDHLKNYSLARRQISELADRLSTRKGIAKYKKYIDIGKDDEYLAAIRTTEVESNLHLLYEEQADIEIMLNEFAMTCDLSSQALRPGGASPLLPKVYDAYLPASETVASAENTWKWIAGSDVRSRAGVLVLNLPDTKVGCKVTTTKKPDGSQTFEMSVANKVVRQFTLKPDTKYSFTRYFFPEGGFFESWKVPSDIGISFPDSELLLESTLDSGQPTASVTIETSSGGLSCVWPLPQH